ncbi:hypothetical protein GGR01_003290 [Acetobacter oeni]|nr:hypothetical protein [Acetobacter oeni]
MFRCDNVYYRDASYKAVLGSVRPCTSDMVGKSPFLGRKAAIGYVASIIRGLDRPVFSLSAVNILSKTPWRLQRLKVIV